MVESNENVEVEIRPSTGFICQFFAAVVASFAALLMGCSLGWSSPVLVLMNTTSSDGFLLTESEEGWLASIVFFGAILGGPLAGIIIDKFGRKKSLGINAFNYAVALVIITASKFKWMLFLGRFLNGVACGFTSICAPTYISEIASPANRGKLGIMFQVMVTIGILAINVVGVVGNWRWITASVIIMDVVWIILLYFIPESPLFYLMKDKQIDAEVVLKKLRGDQNIQDEVTGLRNALESLNNTHSSFSDLFKSYNLKPLLISILVMMGQQSSGINAVLSYSENIFESAHSNLSPLAETIIMDSMMVIATIFAASVSDKLGRRILLQISGSFIILSLFAIGTYYFLDSGHYDIVKSITWLPLVSLSLHVISFSLGYGPIPWLLMSEIFAPEVRGNASAVASVSNWGMGFIVTLTFPILSEYLGHYKVFFLYGGCMAVLLALAIVFVPETKGKTLEEIQRIFRPEEGNINEEEDYDNVSEQHLII